MQLKGRTGWCSLPILDRVGGEAIKLQGGAAFWFLAFINIAWGCHDFFTTVDVTCAWWPQGCGLYSKLGGHPEVSGDGERMLLTAHTDAKLGVLGIVWSWGGSSSLSGHLLLIHMCQLHLAGGAGSAGRREEIREKMV